MYYLINTFVAVGGNHVGYRISAHRTEEAAEKAQSRLAAAIRKNSQNSYLPTAIMSSSEVYIKEGDAYRR